MMKKLFVIKTTNTSPYHNLALEEALLNSVQSGECVLYLWQNRNTVVIGRNQNARSECRIQKLEADGGFLARRLSGGGAVYHDFGNLNFTFLTDAENFDKEKQTDVILEALRLSGINAEKNGRNDITADGRKFSGHAYYQTKEGCYHHGTLMLNVDKEKLSEYLNISPLKLNAKGVKSVKSRVVNLCELRPELTVEALSEKLILAFGEVYNLPVNFMDEKDVDKTLLSELEKRYGSDEWKYAGDNIEPHSVEKRFDWGQARLDYEIKDDVFTSVHFFSDGLEADYLSGIGDRIFGCKAQEDEISKKLKENISDYRDIETINTISENLILMISEEIRRQK